MAVEIVNKCTAFCTAMEKSAKTLFKDYETADKVTIIHKDSKKKDAKKKYEAVKVTFKLSNNKIDKVRTGKAQAGPIATNHSWTCSSAHMADKARHVVPYLNGKAVKNPYTSFKPLMEDYKKKWVAAMGSDLVNCKGEKKYHSDQYHLELKDGKKGIPQKEIDACYSAYVDLTKDQFPKKNADFEKNFKTLLTKLRKKKGILTDEERKALEEKKKRLEEVKKMTFDAKIAGAATVFKNAGAGSKSVKIAGSMVPGDTKEFGKRKNKPVSMTGQIVSKTYTDVKIDVALTMTLVTFEHLKQSFVENVAVKFDVKMSGMLAKVAGVSLDFKFDLALKKAKNDALGKFDINYFIDGIGPDNDKNSELWVISCQTLR